MEWGGLVVLLRPFMGRPMAQGQGSGRVFPKAGALPRSMKLDGPPFFARSMEKDGPFKNSEPLVTRSVKWNKHYYNYL